MKNLFLLPIGKDRFDRPVFRTPAGNAVVDIEPSNPRKELRTKYPAQDAYYGEPDCRLDPELKPVFIDDLIEEANRQLEASGEKFRYVLQDGRVFVNNDVDAGDDFDEIPWKRFMLLVAIATGLKENNQ